MSVDILPSGRIVNTSLQPAMHNLDGNVPVTMGTTISGEDISADTIHVSLAGSTSSYVTTASTTLIMTGRGSIVGICVTETAASTITIYDSLTAAGTILGVLKASIAEGTYLQGVPFSTGCTMVTAGNSKVTAVVSR